MSARERLNLILLLSGIGTSLLGDGLFAIAVGFAVFELGGSALELGAVIGAGLVTLFMCILPAGALADRHSRQWISSGSDLLRACCQVASAVLVAQHQSVWLLLVVSALFGLGTALHQPATVGFVAEVVEERLLDRVNGATQALRGICMVIGAALGGWIVDAHGPAIVLGVDAATFMICAVCFALIRPALRRTEAAPLARRGLTEIREALKLARSTGWLIPGMSLIAGFVFIMLGPMQIVGPAVSRASGGASLWGTISACIALGLIFGGAAAVLGKIRHPLTAVRVLLVIGVTGHLALALDWPTATALPGYIALGAAMGSYGAMWEATKQREVPRDVLSRIGALDWFISLTGMMTGVATASLVVAIWSPAAMLSVMLIGTLALAAGTLASPQLRDAVSRAS